MSASSYIEKHVNESTRVKQSLLEHADSIQEIADSLIACVKSEGRIYTCGNGGSACDAMHFAEELVARYLRDRPGIAAQHLIDAGTITCWANDYDYASVFARQVETLVKSNDTLVVFSTSGNSENISKALDAAKNKGAKSIALLGKDGGKAKELADLSLVVASDQTAHIQEAHITLVHIFCELLEKELF